MKVSNERTAEELLAENLLNAPSEIFVSRYGELAVKVASEAMLLKPMAIDILKGLKEKTISENKCERLLKILNEYRLILRAILNDKE